MKYEFAFIVHSRNVSDIKNNFPFLKFIPDKTIEFLAQFFPPFIISNVEGLKNIDKQPITGCIIACPMTAKWMLNNKKKAKEIVLRAVRLAEKKGAEIVGLGAFTSPVTDGGYYLTDRVKTKITTGNAFTAGIACLDLKSICEEKGINLKDATVAVIGATGSIGSGISKMMTKWGVNRLIMIGKTQKHIMELEGEIGKEAGVYSIEIDDCKDADIIVMATASANVILKKSHLKKGAIVYDISQPKNVPPEITDERPDVSLYDGGLVYTPDIKFTVNLGIPEKTSFACLSETMLLAAGKQFENSLGKVSLERIEKMLALGSMLNFKSKLAK